MRLPETAMPARRIAIVGAGVSGLACAGELVAAGKEVVLFDKGRGPGGRLSTRRLDTPAGLAFFDHGAQYFTARAPEFVRQTEAWVASGVAAAWPQAAPDAWVGSPGMSAIVKAMAENHDIRWGTHVIRLERVGQVWSVQTDEQETGAFDMVVVATPAEQAQSLLLPVDAGMAKTAGRARSTPCWTAMFAFGDRVLAAPSIVRASGAIGWACRNNEKPGRTGPEAWVVQASPEWSQGNLDDNGESVARCLLAELAAALHTTLPEPVASSAHRWRYAMSAGLRLGCLLDTTKGVGACGDWLLGPRIECAWLSGRRLARSILEPHLKHSG